MFNKEDYPPLTLANIKIWLAERTDVKILG